jgi:hypothetical protein
MRTKSVKPHHDVRHDSEHSTAHNMASCPDSLAIRPQHRPVHIRNNGQHRSAAYSFLAQELQQRGWTKYQKSCWRSKAGLRSKARTFLHRKMTPSTLPQASKRNLESESMSDSISSDTSSSIECAKKEQEKKTQEKRQSPHRESSQDP